MASIKVNADSVVRWWAGAFRTDVKARWGFARAALQCVMAEDSGKAPSIAEMKRRKLELCARCAAEVGYVNRAGKPMYHPTWIKGYLTAAAAFAVEPATDLERQKFVNLVNNQPNGQTKAAKAKPTGADYLQTAIRFAKLAMGASTDPISPEQIVDEVSQAVGVGEPVAV